MLVTLLTDFGTADYYVSAMKGVILRRNPNVAIVDITHEVPPQDIATAAFVLLTVYHEFPRQTVHTVVVDPGVGSQRRPIVAVADGQFFVGPDNGIFSYVYDREPDVRVYHVRNERIFRHPVSATFHGRDIFAPAAAALINGISPAELGEEVSDFVRLEPLPPARPDADTLLARIIHIDHFGNCITNVTPADLTPTMTDRSFQLTVSGREITALRQYYAEGDSTPDELFAIWGSAGFLEISINRGSAAQHLGVRRGERVTVSAKQP